MERLRPARAWWRREGRELVQALLGLVLPCHCGACGGTLAQVGLCAACRAHLQQRPEGGCERCGEPLFDGVCTADHRALMGLAFAHAPFRYAGTGGALVRRLKLRGDFAGLPVLAGAMRQAAAPLLRANWRRSLLVPVPLHPRRRRVRGFDQALLLAKAVCRGTRCRVLEHGLRRRLSTLPQGDPRVGSRERNVEGAFEVARPRLVRGCSVLLIDDVLTSGATARACAAVLRAAGAERVAILTACRA